MLASQKSPPSQQTGLFRGLVQRMGDASGRASMLDSSTGTIVGTTASAALVVTVTNSVVAGAATATGGTATRAAARVASACLRAIAFFFIWTVAVEGRKGKEDNQ